MNAIPGITFEKDKKTKRRYEQHNEEVALDNFEKVWASAITGEDIRQRMHKRIDAWPWNKK